MCCVYMSFIVGRGLWRQCRACSKITPPEGCQGRTPASSWLRAAPGGCECFQSAQHTLRRTLIAQSVCSQRLARAHLWEACDQLPAASCLSQSQWGLGEGGGCSGGICTTARLRAYVNYSSLFENTYFLVYYFLFYFSTMVLLEHRNFQFSLIS